MGADFLVHYISWPKNTQPDWADGFKEIERLRALPTEAWPEDYKNSGYGDEDSIPGDAADELSEDLKEVQRVADGGYTREATTFLIGDEEVVLLTGGQSWGDSPTNMYERIDRLYGAGVIHAIGC